MLFIAAEGASAGVLLVIGFYLLLPIGGFLALRAFQRSIPKKLEPLEALLVTEDRAGFINGVGELVSRETPNPWYLRGMLPKREMPVTEENCYRYWHEQFFFQQRDKYNNPIAKAFGYVDIVLAVLFFVPVAILPLIVLHEYWWFVLPFLTLPSLAIMALLLWFQQVNQRYKADRFELYRRVDERFVRLIGGTQA